MVSAHFQVQTHLDPQYPNEAMASMDKNADKCIGGKYQVPQTHQCIATTAKSKNFEAFCKI